MSTYRWNSSSQPSWSGGRVTDCSYCLLAPNPSPLTSMGTNTWIVSKPEESSCVVIDPGPEMTEHAYQILGSCQAEGKTIAAIMITHDHIDHAPGAQELSRLTGAPVFSQKRGNLPDGPLGIEDANLTFEVVSLPGHSSDSVGFILRDDGSFFTGDVIFARSSTMICWPDGSLAQYLDTLDKMSALVQSHVVKRLLTGHGVPVDEPLDRIAVCRRHRIQRLNQIVLAVRSGIPAQADKLVDTVYSDVAPSLSRAAERSVNAQLRYAFDTGLLEEHRRQR